MVLFLGSLPSYCLFLLNLLCWFFIIFSTSKPWNVWSFFSSHSSGVLTQSHGFKGYPDTENSKNYIFRQECFSKLHRSIYTTAYLIFLLTSLKFNMSILVTTSNTHTYTSLLFPEISPFHFLRPKILETTLTSLYLLYFKSKSSGLPSKEVIQKVICTTSSIITVI